MTRHRPAPAAREAGSRTLLPTNPVPMRALRRLAVVALSISLSWTVSAQVPNHPDDLSFPALDFEPPRAENYRHELSVHGVPVYMIPSDEVPLVDVSFTFKGGSYLEPSDQTGIGSILGTMLRRGGTTSVSAQELDERLDFLAADVSTFVGSDTSGASLNCLVGNLDEALELFVDMLRNPGFDAERLRVHKDGVIERFRQRNDSPMGVAQPEMRRLLYGDDHYLSREATVQTLAAVTPESLRALHARIFHPGNLLIAVTGDFDEPAMLARLERALSDWTAGPRAADPPAPDATLRPGLYHARTSQGDLPQGTALLLQRSVQRDHPDAITLDVMNDILGGGGFTSRITNKVRSDEGLAYSASSFFQPQVWFPGLFGAFFQSRNETVALAAQLCLDEMRRIQSEPVTDEELSRTKNSFIEQFPQAFASKPRMASTFVNDELTGRDPSYWQTYRERVAGITAADVQRAAAEHLRPEEIAILIVGDWDAMVEGDLQGRASMKEFFGGQVNHLPVRDPLTREPMQADDTDT